METILLFFVCGFVASLIDGCVGMAYGAFLTTALTSFGIPILNASSTIHFCEIFTSFASGVSHFVNGNFNFALLKRIMFSGVIGGLLGALFLVFTRDLDLKPYVAIYLLILGVRILIKANQKSVKNKAVLRHLLVTLTGANTVASLSNTPLSKIRSRSLSRIFVRTFNNKGLIPLGFIGGFFDAAGGGGWGPIVTSSLLAKGHTPAKVIGTVNAAEFFVTLTQVLVFVTVVDIINWQMVLGLVLGGCIASPLSALFVKRVNPKVLMCIVAILIILINLSVLTHCLLQGDL